MQWSWSLCGRQRGFELLTIPETFAKGYCSPGLACSGNSFTWPSSAFSSSSHRCRMIWRRMPSPSPCAKSSVSKMTGSSDTKDLQVVSLCSWHTCLCGEGIHIIATIITALSIHHTASPRSGVSAAPHPLRTVYAECVHNSAVLVTRPRPSGPAQEIGRLIASG
jgi:hypothetical protein